MANWEAKLGAGLGWGALCAAAFVGGCGGGSVDVGGPQTPNEARLQSARSGDLVGYFKTKVAQRVAAGLLAGVHGGIGASEEVHRVVAVHRRQVQRHHGELLRGAALQEQERSGALDDHRDWIGGLLAQYYDPMYSYQREQKKDRVIFQGDADAVLNYLRRHG